MPARPTGVAPSCSSSGEGAACAAIAIMSKVLSAIGATRGAIALNCSYEVATISLAMSPSDCHATATAIATPTQNVIGGPRRQESAWHSSLFPVHGNATSFVGESAMTPETYKRCKCSARKWPRGIRLTIRRRIGPFRTDEQRRKWRRVRAEVEQK